MIEARINLPDGAQMRWIFGSQYEAGAAIVNALLLLPEGARGMLIVVKKIHPPEIEEA